MTEQTATIWAERVRAWRSSGQSAAQFAAAHGFAESTLRWWASQLRAGSASAPVSAARKRSRPSKARATASASTEKSVTFARVVRAESAAARPSVKVAPVEVVVGEVRVRVERDVDETALRVVFRALGVAR